MSTGGDDDELAGLVPAVMERLPAILGEVRESLAQQHPGYAEFLATASDEVLVPARGFISRLVASVDHHPDTTDPPAVAPDGGVEQAIFEEIGREHRRQGQDITALLAAYRIGATVAWRHVTDAAAHIGVAVEIIPLLAGTVFAAVDQLSSASLHGFLAEQSDAAHARDRHRHELAELLLSERCDSGAVRAAAGRADWALPQQAAVVLVDPDNEVARLQLTRLSQSCLHLRRSDALIAIVADPAGPGQQRRLATTLGGTAAVVGETVALDELPASLRRAEIAARLRRTGRLRAGPDPLFVAEHLAALLVHHDEHLLASLRRTYLAPLTSLPGPARERLEPTLRCWLEQMGNQKAIAADLRVHPQTVRYRLAQLRELFGSHLDDPDTRAALLVALSWDGPVDTEPGPAQPPHRGPEAGSGPSPAPGTGPVER